MSWTFPQDKPQAARENLTELSKSRWTRHDRVFPLWGLRAPLCLLGEPPLFPVPGSTLQRSPRPRGLTAEWEVADAAQTAFPAVAAMNRSMVDEQKMTGSVPRARGDEPMIPLRSPSNGYNCRCRRIALSEKEVSSSSRPMPSGCRTRSKSPPGRPHSLTQGGITTSATHR